MNIQKGQSGNIVFYPPSNYHAVPSDAEVRISTPSTSMPAEGLEVSASVDPVDAVISVEAKKGSRELTFSSAPSFTAGREYLITTAQGLTCTVDVLNDGTTVTIAQGLPFELSVGDTVKGVAIIAALNTSQTSEEGQGLIYASAIIDGKKVVWQVQFHILKVVPRLTLTWSKFVEMYPVGHSMIASSTQQPRKLIEHAWTQDMKPRLERKQLRIEYIKSWAELEPAHALCVRYRLFEDAYPKDIEIVDQARKRYLDALNAAIEGTHSWYSEPDEVDASPAIPIKYTSVGLTR